jgi:DNA ligase-4
MAQPSIMFEQPLCAEVMGAGFQKVPFSQYYDLRWPRLQKIFPPNERKWTEGKIASIVSQQENSQEANIVQPSPAEN